MGAIDNKYHHILVSNIFLDPFFLLTLFSRGPGQGALCRNQEESQVTPRPRRWCTACLKALTYRRELVLYFASTYPKVIGIFVIVTQLTVGPGNCFKLLSVFVPASLVSYGHGHLVIWEKYFCCCKVLHFTRFSFLSESTVSSFRYETVTKWFYSQYWKWLNLTTIVFYDNLCFHVHSLLPSHQLCLGLFFFFPFSSLSLPLSSSPLDFSNVSNSVSLHWLETNPFTRSAF